MVVGHKVYSFLDRFFWLPSNHHNIGRLIQNNLHHQMGHFYVVSHAFHIKEHATNLPINCQHSFQRISWCVYEAILG